MKLLPRKKLIDFAFIIKFLNIFNEFAVNSFFDKNFTDGIQCQKVRKICLIRLFIWFNFNEAIFIRD